MSVLLKCVKWVFILVLSLLILLSCYTYYVVASFDTKTLPENHGKVNTKLYLGQGDRQPLIVGFGGSEGGNAWTSNYWKKQREEFLEQGYAFLAIGYFGMHDTPKYLDRISLDAIHKTVMDTINNPQINQDCIAVMGGSKGGELALTLASYYHEYKAVVGIVPGNAVFASLTDAMTTSSISFNGVPLPFVPVPWSATPALLGGDLRKAFEIMLEDQSAVNQALIKVEQINGPILLVSATADEMWPSKEMSEQIMTRLKAKKFNFKSEHLVIEGGHTEPLKHFDKITQFLNDNFMSENATNCLR